MYTQWLYCICLHMYIQYILYILHLGDPPKTHPPGVGVNRRLRLLNFCVPLILSSNQDVSEFATPEKNRENG